jgi:hypothetical protein
VKLQFKTCTYCESQLTIRQFSKRYPDVCRHCVPDYIRQLSIIESRELEDHLLKKQSKLLEMDVVKIQPKVKLKSPGESKSKGYKINDVIKRPVIRSSSNAFNSLSAEKKREILKAEYKLRKEKEYREKKLKKTS